MSKFVKMRERFFNEVHGKSYSETNRDMKTEFSHRYNKKFRSCNRAIRYVLEIGDFKEAYPCR